MVGLEDFSLNYDKTYKKSDVVQYSHPILLSKRMLIDMNFFDDRYFPGWSLDHDIPRTAYEFGCRNFIMLGNSRMYQRNAF